MKITEEQLLKIMPYARQRAKKFVEPLNSAMEEFGVDTRLRIAAFLSQIGHESGQLLYVKELASGHAYDSGEKAKKLGNDSPEAIAIAKSNGTTVGVFYKGRGLIQVTGYNNYILMMMKLNIDCVEHPELLEQPINACRSAALFWSENNINEYADKGDIDGVSDEVNKGRKTVAIGDTNGWNDRLSLYKKALEVLPEDL